MKRVMELSAIIIFSYILLFLQSSPISANQFYLSVQGGEGDMVTGNANFKYVNKKTGGFAYRIALGYLFNITAKLQIGPEFGYLRYRKSEYTVRDQHGNVLVIFNYTGYTRDILINMHYAITPKVYGIAKVGVAYVQQKFKLSTVNPTLIEATKTKSLPELSIGIGYNFNRHISITGTINNTFGGERPMEKTTLPGFESVANVSTIMLSLHYSFA